MKANSMKYVRYAAMILLFLALMLRPADGVAEPRSDQEWVFDLPAKTSSQIYQRPADAEYFWWDTDAAVQVELEFAKGGRKTVGSEEVFREKIISVKFINPGDKVYQVKLWARFK